MDKDTVTMVKGDERAEVSPDDSVKIMEGHGWKLADAADAVAPRTLTPDASAAAAAQKKGKKD